MKIADFGGSFDVTNEAEVQVALSKRYGEDANEFWLWHLDGGYPAMSIMVRADKAVLHYFPDDQRAGFQTVALECDDPAGDTIFYITSVNEEMPMPNSAVVPFANAILAADEFFSSGVLPCSVEWQEL